MCIIRQALTVKTTRRTEIKKNQKSEDQLSEKNKIHQAKSPRKLETKTIHPNESITF